MSQEFASEQNQRRSVLLLVTEPILGELICYRLELLGYETQLTTTQDELENVLETTLPQLFLVDLDSIEQDHLQLVERLTANEVTTRIPVVCLSQEGDLDRAEKAYHAGAKDLLVVPFDPILLENKVAHWYEESERGALLASQ
ncbi:MAG: two-component system response regulator [Aureliella sp.]